MNFFQEKSTYFAAPTAFIRTFCVYIGVLAFRLRYIYLRFLTRKTTNVIRY